MTNHIHRYERASIGRKGYMIWRCNLPDCNHYIAFKLGRGKRSICNRCGKEMLLDSRAMKLEKPHCVDCIAVRKKPHHDDILEFIEANDMSAPMDSDK